MPTELTLSAPPHVATSPSGPAATPMSAAMSPFALVLTGIVLLAFLPLAYVHGQHLWAKPHYQFFPLILAGAAILAWSRWKDVAALAPGSAMTTTLGAAVAWLMLVAAEVLYSPTLAVVAGIVLVLAWLYGLGGWPLVKTLWPAWAFLGFLVPLPFGLDRRLVLSMQTITSQWSGGVFDVIGLFHHLSGNVVEITGKRLLVEEACAGVNSLFALLACSAFLIFWLRRPWLRAVLLMIASIGWVLASNVVRIVAIAVANDRWQYDLSAGIRHDLLGFACFLLAVALIWSTDRFFLFFKPRWGDDQAAAPTGTTLPMPWTRLTRLCPWPMAAAFAVPLLFHLAAHGLTGDDDVNPTLLPSVAKLDKASFPDSFNGWKLAAYRDERRAMGSAFGEFSKIWTFQRDKQTAIVSLDYPFAGFHDLWECYAGHGWTREKHFVHNDPKATESPSFWIEMKLKKPGLHAGYVAFCELDPSGGALEQEGRLGATFKRYERKLASWMPGSPSDARNRGPRGPVYQIQLFIESDAPLSSEEHAAVRELYFESIKNLRPRLFEGS